MINDDSKSMVVAFAASALFGTVLFGGFAAWAYSKLGPHEQGIVALASKSPFGSMGSASAAPATIAGGTKTAAKEPELVYLEPITVIGHRHAVDADIAADTALPDVVAHANNARLARLAAP